MSVGMGHSGSCGWSYWGRKRRTGRRGRSNPWRGQSWGCAGRGGGGRRPARRSDCCHLGSRFGDELSHHVQALLVSAMAPSEEEGRGRALDEQRDVRELVHGLAHGSVLVEDVPDDGVHVFDCRVRERELSLEVGVVEQLLRRRHVDVGADPELFDSLAPSSGRRRQARDGEHLADVLTLLEPDFAPGDLLRVALLRERDRVVRDELADELEGELRALHVHALISLGVKRESLGLDVIVLAHRDCRVEAARLLRGRRQLAQADFLVRVSLQLPVVLHLVGAHGRRVVWHRGDGPFVEHDGAEGVVHLVLVDGVDRRVDTPAPLAAQLLGDRAERAVHLDLNRSQNLSHALAPEPEQFWAVAPNHERETVEGPVFVEEHPARDCHLVAAFFTELPLLPDLDRVAQLERPPAPHDLFVWSRGVLDDFGELVRVLRFPELLVERLAVNDLASEQPPRARILPIDVVDEELVDELPLDPHLLGLRVDEEMQRAGPEHVRIQPRHDGLDVDAGLVETDLHEARELPALLLLSPGTPIRDERRAGSHLPNLRVQGLDDRADDVVPDANGAQRDSRADRATEVSTAEAEHVSVPVEPRVNQVLAAARIRLLEERSPELEQLCGLRLRRLLPLRLRLEFLVAHQSTFSFGVGSTTSLKRSTCSSSVILSTWLRVGSRSSTFVASGWGSQSTRNRPATLNCCTPMRRRCFPNASSSSPVFGAKSIAGFLLELFDAGLLRA